MVEVDKYVLYNLKYILNITNIFNKSHIYLSKMKKAVTSKLDDFGPDRPLHINNYLYKLRREGLFYVPFWLKRVVVKNIGPIKNLDIKLKKINLIVGKNATGKTILLHLIHSVGNRHQLSDGKFISHGYKNGKIILELAKPINRFEYAFYIDSNNNEKYSTNMESKCYLVDDPFVPSDTLEPKKILDYLKQFHSQLIITCRKIPNIDLKGINIIKL